MEKKINSWSKNVSVSKIAQNGEYVKVRTEDKHVFYKKVHSGIIIIPASIREFYSNKFEHTVEIEKADMKDINKLCLYQKGGLKLPNKEDWGKSVVVHNTDGIFHRKTLRDGFIPYIEDNEDIHTLRICENEDFIPQTQTAKRIYFLNFIVRFDREVKKNISLSKEVVETWFLNKEITSTLDKELKLCLQEKSFGTSGALIPTYFIKSRGHVEIIDLFNNKRYVAYDKYAFDESFNCIDIDGKEYEFDFSHDKYKINFITS